MPSDWKSYVENVPAERPPVDFCAESQSIPARIGAFLSYGFLVSYALCCKVYWMIICLYRKEIDPLAEIPKPGYASILKGFGAFYQRVMFALVNDCWSRPVCSAPGVWVDVMHRKRKHKLDLEFDITGETTRCSNLGSYNYLGFATAAEGESEIVMRQCNDKMNEEVARSLRYGVAMGASAHEAGSTDLHKLLEKKVATFVGKEDSLVFGMGYATNTTNIPLLAGPGTLVVSDSLNHASLVVGCRSSGATCEIFRHNDLDALENLLTRSIRRGQDATGKQYIPWKKILIIVEGIYSMEGEILRLPEIIAIKKKYKAYLYVDEAHSIGSLGARGRGVCDYWGVDPNDVDILMGTFTKSFSSVGGYIAGSADVIRTLRVTSIGMVYATAMPVPCVQQILCAMRVISGEDGTDEGKLRIRRLRENSIYFRRRLKDEGFVVAGDYDSPVIPMMIYNPFKFCGLSRALMLRNIAIVVVGYPATPLLLGRARFCMSSAHTIEQLERAVQNIAEIGKNLHLDYNNNNNPIKFLLSI